MNTFETSFGLVRVHFNADAAVIHAGGQDGDPKSYRQEEGTMSETDAMVSVPPMMLVGEGETAQRMERSAVHAVIASTLGILIEEIALAIRIGKITEPAQVLVVLGRVREHYAPGE